MRPLYTTAQSSGRNRRSDPKPLLRDQKQIALLHRPFALNSTNTSGNSGHGNLHLVGRFCGPHARDGGNIRLHHGVCTGNTCVMYSDRMRIRDLASVAEAVHHGK